MTELPTHMFSNTCKYAGLQLFMPKMLMSLSELNHVESLHVMHGATSRPHGPWLRQHDFDNNFVGSFMVGGGKPVELADTFFDMHSKADGTVCIRFGDTWYVWQPRFDPVIVDPDVKSDNNYLSFNIAEEGAPCNHDLLSYDEAKNARAALIVSMVKDSANSGVSLVYKSGSNAGKNASNAGKNASNSGKNSSNSGKNSNNAGKNSSNAGKKSGTNSSNAGRNAGANASNTGKNAGANASNTGKNSGTNASNTGKKAGTNTNRTASNTLNAAIQNVKPIVNYEGPDNQWDRPPPGPPKSPWWKFGLKGGAKRPTTAKWLPTSRTVKHKGAVRKLWRLTGSAKDAAVLAVKRIVRSADGTRKVRSERV